MKAKVELEDMGARENGAKVRIVQKYSLAFQKLIYKGVYELDDHVGEEALKLGSLLRFGPKKRTHPTSFPNYLL
jgi:hypothetical protein